MNAYLRSLITHSIRIDRQLKCGSSSKQCGDACVPKKKKCKTGNVSLKLTNHVNAKVEYLEDKIKDLDYERAIFVDAKTGAVLLNKGGQQTSVDFTNEEVTLMRGAIVTHNHPNAYGYPKNHPASKGLSFSQADIQAACVGEVAEMRAVSSGYRHVLKPPKEGWHAGTYFFKVKPAYERHEREVIREYQEKIWQGKILIADAEANVNHEVVRRTAQETGMRYERIPIKDRR